MEMTASDMKIGLHPVDDLSKVKGSGSTSIVFVIDDFDKVKTTLTETGITFKEQQEKGGNFIHFNDPDGIALYFIDPKW